ncbi:hypothetical protein DL763_008431 [Monosporascus cannonballus]|nr:hypothetical protein DL763_008431 [Monosporascus cannonballus]
MSARPSKKRRLTPPQSRDEDVSRWSEKKIQKQFFKNAASWDLEQDYETKARKGKKKEKKESTRLPIRLPDGRLQQVTAPASDLRSVESDEDWLEEDGGGDVSDEGPQERAVPEKPDIPEPQQILEAKEELAKLASALNENPEESVGNFKAIAKIGESHIPAIQKLTLATQLAVYRDVIPGYRIRPISEDGPGEKLSKEVRKLRAYEQSLVSSYQAYVRNLARYAKTGKQQEKNAKAAGGQSISSIAITCACTLLTSVPHFNFRSDLIKILVGKLSTRRVDDDFNKCLRALETLFHEDEEGRPAMEAVSLLSKMMRAREYEVDESVVNLFLHLRLLSEFAGKASRDTVEHADGAGKKVSNKAAKREFRTKRKRKELKEQKALQKDLAQADAVVGHEERDRMQSETLKLVFATYFRILKLRQPHLMGAVLEGLAKYAHLINQDFFGDLLEALKDLIRHSDAAAADGGEAVEGAAAADDEDDGDAPVRNPSREALLCTVTAFALLAGQDAHNARSALHLALSFFTTHLYKTLLPLSLNPDLELGTKSLRLPDPNAPSAPHPSTTTSTGAGNKVNLQTTTVLLVRCLTAALLPAWNARSVPPLRLASFTKQLMTASLQVPERSAQALLALLADVGGLHGRRVAALWHTEERRGDGAFNPLSASVEAANPFAATVWEGEILRRHYCPKVREGLRLVERSMLQK